MAISFKNTKGTAESNKVEAFEYKDGENTVRIVGDILPRYMYWLKGTNGKEIPVECLAFNRDKEKFDRAEQDHVTSYFPDAKCSWAYSVNCIDPKDGKVKVLHLKKKLFQQILDAANDLGDPTDMDTGFDIVFKRAKTGPLPFNVEYNLSVLRCKPRALSEDERAPVAAAKTIEQKFPRPTPDQVKTTLDKITTATDDSEQSEAEGEAVNELSS